MLAYRSWLSFTSLRFPKSESASSKNRMVPPSSAASKSLRRLFSVPVKGKAQEVALIELTWQPATEERTLIVSPHAKADTGQALLELDLDGVRVEMGPQRRKVTIGRDLEADYTVRDRSASRAHAMIERRRERFVLADHSSNGTYVTFDGRPEMKVHHEELTLVGHGWIAFGQPRSEAAQVAEFRCVDGGLSESQA